MKSLSFILIIVVSGIGKVKTVSDTLPSDLDEDTEDAQVSEPAIDFSDKHESLLTCSSFYLNADEYVLFPNGTAFVEAYNRTYTERHYILRGGSLIVCTPDDIDDDGRFPPPPRSPLASSPMQNLTEVGLGVSMVFLLVHLLVFAVVPDLQNLPGYNLASLCASLFFSYLFLIVAPHDIVVDSPAACVASAVLTQFFFLSSFCWMSIMAFEVFRSVLHATVSLRISSKGFKPKKYFYNSLVAWSVPLAFTAAGLVAEYAEGVPDMFRPGFRHVQAACWFKSKQSLLAFFAGPVIALISVNFLLFGLSAFSIFCNRMKGAERQGSGKLKKSHVMYFRLAVIMGVTWVTGALAPLANVLWLWYLFAALNTLQGFFIFVAFTCTKKARKFFMAKLGVSLKTSQQTLTPTFQSYCFYASSIEKDLDKVMQNKERTGSADTVVIHL